MKKKITLVIASMLVLALSQPASSVSFDPNLVPIPEGYATISIAEESGKTESRLNVQPPGPDENLNRGEWIDCESVSDPKCDLSDPKNDIIGWMMLPSCSSAADEDCVESMSITTTASSSVGVAAGEIPKGQVYPAVPRLNFFEAGRVPIYEVAGMPNVSGGIRYAVMATASVRYYHADKKFRTEGLSASVVPIGQFQIPPSLANTQLNCLWKEGSTCYAAEDFSAGVRVNLKVRLADEVGGWFLGRMQAPNISVTAVSRTNNLIEIEAAPIKVPRLAITVPQSSLTLADRKAIGNSGSIGELGKSGQVFIQTQAQDQSIFKMIEYFRSWVDDTAAGETSLWTVTTVAGAPGSGCLADKTRVLGIVTTNAMGYDGFSPRYENGTLNYKVAGLHYAPNGKDLNLGTYDLVMRSETARCLYGFSRAPLSATVTVTGTGDQNVATTFVTEKDGWLKMAAYGFTFSEKEIKVKVTQRQARTLTGFAGSTQSLTAKQKAEIRAVLNKSSGNAKFVCTGVYLNPRDKARATSRARATCNYAKSLDKNFSFFSQAKLTKAASSNNKVMISSR